ncbi:AraC family transcriptional regulator [Spirosoma utsteinense]|uniref:AraC-like DNA-binding protein n=1 Tax=Spirosoma utsteinense TaxID=2585773 RepID=A0ABR6WCC7_9BACT|nr:AraC family transcriptional regulator [Spirosoma utsteinense]MBC3783849.1 AraC-like DNA-binding protein [Spirosoma utsteinense]MBC3793572.1 AraC-like DNA-binding protein [Spirosoma utsteinense]
MHDYQKLLALSLLAYGAQKNLPVEQLCQLSGIDLEEVKADGPMTSRQLDDLWINATHLSGDVLFGLHFGESLQIAALGVVGQLIRNSHTIGEALTQAATFTHLLTDALTMEVKRTNAGFAVQFIPNQTRQRAAPAMFCQLMDFMMAFLIHEVDGLVLTRIQPDQVTLPSQIADLTEYERVLRCPTIREGDKYELTFAGNYWNEPILLANYDLQTTLLQEVNGVERSYEAHQRMSDRIKSYLLANANLGLPSLDAIAGNFNLSPRSVQRKLQEEGLTYQQVADSVRKTLAIHFLESGRHPTKEVSYILGYNELSAFSRAFKRWTGTTPGGYQKNQRGIT